MLDNARRRAKAAGIPFTISLNDIHIPKRCPVFGTLLRNNWGKSNHWSASPTLDRIIPTRGYVPGNVLVICWRANRLKNDATPRELRQLARFYRKFT